MNIPDRKALVALLVVLSAASGIAGCGGAESRKAHHMERGLEFFAAENYDKARVEFRNALQITPNDAEARFQAGLAAEKLQNPREAAQFFQGAIDADANHARARAELAKYYVFAGAPQRGLDLIEPGLKTQPQNPDLLVVRAAARMALSDLQAAFEDVQAALKQKPGMENALALLASWYVANGEENKAVEVLKDASARLPQSVDMRLALAQLYSTKAETASQVEPLLRDLIRIKPKDPEHRYRLMNYLARQKRVDEAETVLRDALRALPDTPGVKTALVQFMTAFRPKDVAEAELRKLTAANPGDRDLEFAVGGFLEKTGQADKALAWYERIVKQQGDKPAGLEARNRLASLHAQAGRLDQARALVAQVLSENPRDADALILRGNIALAQNDAAGAIADLRAVLRDQPRAVPVLRSLARAHLQNNEPALAEESLQSAVAAEPNNLDARIDLADLFARSGKPEQALKLLEASVRTAPDNRAAREALFRAQFSAKQFAAAARTAEDIKLMLPQQALGYYFAGLVAQAQDHPEDSIRELERALELQPDGVEPLSTLAKVHLARKDGAAAIARLKKAVNAQPGNAAARNLLGEVLLAEKQLPEARSTLEQTIRIAPTWWVPYRGLALAHLAANDRAGAVAVFQQGIQAASEPLPLAIDVAALYERGGEYEKAISEYEALLERYPKLDVATNNLAMLLANYRRDKASLDRAGTLANALSGSSNPAYLNTRGWVSFKRGDTAAALPLLEQAVDRMPDAPAMRYQLGIAQYRNGQLEQARASLSRALESGQRFAGAEDARATLQQIDKQTSKPNTG